MAGIVWSAAFRLKNYFDMQVFVPYPSPIDVAKCLDSMRLRKQIIECDQILKAISGESQAWKNHPVVKTYEHYYSWLHDYCLCLEYYLAKNSDMAEYWNLCANGCTPSFLTEEFCIQHRRRLYTKDPEHYSKFGWEVYGTSDENWYYLDGQIVKYVNGKRI